MGIRHLLAIVLSLGLVVVPGGTANAGADRELAEAEFVAMINELRIDRGLSPLSVDTELVMQARLWASAMASDQELRHAPDLSVGAPGGWDVLGENVGVHSILDVERLFVAFVESPSHLANLVDPRFERVGIGVAYDNEGAIWTTHRFMSIGGSVSLNE